MAYPPKLLCKHRLVYNAEFFKTNTSFPSIQADFIPMKHMHLSNPLVMTPPKVSDIESNFLQMASGTLKQEKV